jgi:type II secretory pathway component PulC
MIKRILSISFLMIVSLVWFVIPCMAQTQKDSKSKNAVSQATTDVSTTVGSDERPEFFYDSKGKPDPMDVPWFHKEFIGNANAGPKNDAPKKVEINVEERLTGQVTGIVYSEIKPEDSLALIGIQIVKIGDNVKIEQLPKMAKVSKINKQEVILVYEGKTYPVKISGS